MPPRRQRIFNKIEMTRGCQRLRLLTARASNTNAKIFLNFLQGVKKITCFCQMERFFRPDYIF